MMLRSMFLLLICGATAAAFLDIASASARVVVHHRAAEFVEPSMATGIAALKQSIAEQIAAGVDPRSGRLSAPGPLPETCASQSAPCQFYVDVAVQLNSSAFVPASPSPCAASTSCAENLQANPYVAEGRIAASVTVQILSAVKAVLAERTDDVTLRTFAQRPYVTIAGVSDRSVAGAAHTAGDDGGGTVSLSASTQVFVKYHNDSTGAEISADRWQNAEWKNGGTPGGWDP